MNFQRLILRSALCVLIPGFTLPPSLALGSDWIRLPYRLSAPDTYVRYTPYIAADSSGRTHVFWSEDSNRPCCSNGQFSLYRYARFDGVSWSGPIDVARVIDGRVESAAISLDSNEGIHVAWIQNGGGAPNGTIFYRRTALDNALDPDGWSPSVQLPMSNPRVQGLQLRVEESGTLHMVLTKTATEEYGIFHTRSEDAGSSWSDLKPLDPGITEQFTPGIFRFELDDRDALHVVWHYFGGSSVNFAGLRVLYSRSLDSGVTWSSPFTIDEFEPGVDDPLTESAGSPYGFVVDGERVHIVWVGGPTGAPIGVGRKHRVSFDRGVTWGETRLDAMGTWGNQNGDGAVSDGSGGVYWVGTGRKITNEGLVEGMWESRWRSGQWEEAFQVPVGRSVDGPRLARTTNGQLVTAYRDFPQPAQLWATNTSGPVFYFPQCGDGSGLSMLFAFNNPSADRATGVLTAFDTHGAPQALPFAGEGLVDRIELSLEPHSTRVLRTLGTSSPLKTGYVRVELDKAEVGGVAIFQYSAGPEASVLPAQPGRRLALFVELSSALKTGIALARLTPSQPVNMTLYELDGSLRDSREYQMTGAQEARFLDELFPGLPPQFRGLLVMESEALISSVGLRFGGGVLSTIPVADLDSAASQGVYFFPHYGDGAGLSMLFAVSNLEDADATGQLSVFDASGNLQDLPFEDGPASQVPLALPSKATELFGSNGSSSPLKTGFVEVALDQPGSTGVAIFKYASGLEASVLPSYAGRRFALFVERSSSLDSGIAVSRSGLEPVTLELYDESGRLSGSRELLFDQGDRKVARFLSEIFGAQLPSDFRGLLVMSSEGEFACVGLRFGSGVLSTIPVSPVE